MGAAAGWSVPPNGDELQPGEPPGAGPADRPQHELSLFLQLELFHSLGAYERAARGMRLLKERMEIRKWEEPWKALISPEALERMASYNEALREGLHRPVTDSANSSLSDARLCSRHPDPEGSLGRSDRRHKWVIDFYRSVIEALSAPGAPGASPSKHHMELSEMLKLVHDPQRQPADPARVAHMKIKRNERRLAEAEPALQRGEGVDRTREILKDHLDSGQRDALHTHVIGALIEAHIRMHHAEHLLWHGFGDKVRGRAQIDKICEQELNLSVVLNTFAYAASRMAPWIFAARKEESKYLRHDYRDCCNSLTPTYCIWLSKQVTLLALQRRAYTWLLLEEGEKAHNDFQKLKRFARDLERQFEGRIEQPAGIHLFLQGLSASADHHSGRIYRLYHAYPAAMRHLDRSALQLGRLERDPGAAQVLRNSRWRVQLFVNQGKVSYELGLTKQTLMSNMCALRAYLELAETETTARANLQEVARAIAWLESVEPDAEVSKVALAEHVGPVVEQLKVMRGPTHLRALAAEIMTRLAHVLFALKLPPVHKATAATGPFDDIGTDHHLAFLCLQQAALLDPSQTLIAADTLKLGRARRAYATASGVSIESLDAPAGKKRTDRPIPIGRQWPGGGGSFEEAARVIEYVLHRWLDATASESHDDDDGLARYLLESFLVHTDSTNVKQAQVYRYLMQEEAAGSRPLNVHAIAPSTHATWTGAAEQGSARESPPVGDGRWLEFVCLRRYSSFFPFVPRPMAFPVLGGGYFVRVHGPGAMPVDRPEPFGIAIDPGPDFIDNLYRVGYRLADVHMMLVTHDHPDHMVALDPMLSLLYQRSKLLAQTFAGKKLIIAGNDSVKSRYSFYDHERSKVKVLTFEELEREIAFENLFRPPEWLKFECVRTVEHRDTGRNVAQGVLLSTEGHDSHGILFTSDTGPLDESDLDKRRDPNRKSSKGKLEMRDAIARADLVVAHVSAIPLPQLRELANLSAAASLVEETKQFNSLWQTLYEQVKDRFESPEEGRWAAKYRFILRQLQYGFHSLPKMKNVTQVQGAGNSDPLAGLNVSPLSPDDELSALSPNHLYLDGLLWFARQMRHASAEKLLLVGELHEELGMFRTRIASALNKFVFKDNRAWALTADIGLKVRVGAPKEDDDARGPVDILCSTCALDNDLVDSERFHQPRAICEVCVKGEDEGVFYNCDLHDPDHLIERAWIERIERYDPFGH